MLEFPGKYTTAKVFIDNIDDATISQIINFVNHEAFTNPISIMPDTHAGKGAVIGFTMKMTKKIIPNVIGVDIGCFTKETRIPLLDGIEYSLEELLNLDSFYVYSLNEQLQIVPGKAKCFKTRSNADLIQVGVSGGEIITCTPDHEFMMLDGNYKQAKDLKPFDSLMPFYRTYQTREGSFNRHVNSHTTDNNHKVLFVRPTERKEDVYCLQVEKYHNFALSAGVFVHNCGMLSMNLGKISLPSVDELDKQIRQLIPFGSDIRDESFKFDDSFFYPLNALIIMFSKAYRNKFNEAYLTEEVTITDIEKMTQDMNMDYARFLKSVGTLGGGNHFIEFSHDLNDDIWFTVHSGSRQFGSKICNFWQKKGGKGELAYLEGSDMYYYLVDMIIAQHYAQYNRYEMADKILQLLGTKPTDTIECVHNYVNFTDFIMRKGAVSSYKGQRIIVPFNMEDGILICEGLGNEEWNNSAPHGSGRIGPRKLAKEIINKEEASDRMKSKGIYASVIPVDETKEAYKDPKIIEDAIAPTAKIINRLIPILACKDKK